MPEKSAALCGGAARARIRHDERHTGGDRVRAMSRSHRVVRGVVVIDVSGEMTGLDAPGRLKGQVVEAIGAGHRRVVLNMSGLAFADSSLIGELVASLLAIERAGGTLKLAGTVRRVQEVLHITRLAAVIESFETERAAVDSFYRPGH
jgi:anti-anti-sigma factor